MGRTNSTFLFGPTRYVVGPDAGASHSTIASAVAAVTAAGSPATIYIQPGTYSESISWPSNVTVEAAANLISGTFCSPTVTIIGNQTFAGTGSIFLQAIKFVAIAGNVWTIGNAAGNCASFKDCQISSAILSGRGIVITGSGAGDCVLDLQNSLIGTADDCVYASYADISVARCNLNCLNASKANLNFVTHVDCSSDLNIFSSSNGDNVILTDGTCTYNSISSRYLQGDSAFVFGAAGATAISCYEYIDSSAASGYFARSTGVYGALQYGNLTLPGTAQSVDPQITATALAHVPSSSATGITWNFVAANALMTANNGYVCVSPGGALTLSLPAVAAQGTELNISLDGATSWQITQAAGQRVLFGNTQTTSGAGGSITSTSQGDSLRLLCTTANLRWVVLSAVGNPTII